MHTRVLLYFVRCTDLRCSDGVASFIPSPETDSFHQPYSHRTCTRSYCQLPTQYFVHKLVSIIQYCTNTVSCGDNCAELARPSYKFQPCRQQYRAANLHRKEEENCSTVHSPKPNETRTSTVHGEYTILSSTIQYCTRTVQYILVGVTRTERRKSRRRSVLGVRPRRKSQRSRSTNLFSRPSNARRIIGTQA